MRRSFVVVLLLVLAVIVYTQFTLFVVQPIGAVPKGGTLLILRLNTGRFIDSADAMCIRIQESVNLLCRGMVLGAVANNSTVIARFPYSRTLYLISTDGKEYSSPSEASQTTE
jgi:hypothetical protein